MAVTTLDPAHVYRGTLTNGNLTITASAAAGLSWSTTAHATGKWHTEVTLGGVATQGNQGFGIGTSNADMSAGIGTDVAGTSLANYTGTETGAFSINIYALNTSKVNATAGGAGPNDTMAIEIDFDAQLLWYRASYASQWNNSGTANPATGVGGISFAAWLTKGPAYYFGLNPFVSGYVQTANFGATAFAVTPSSGFNAWQSTGPPVTKNAAALMIGA